MDPHPNPPHKGEGTLPRAQTFLSVWKRRQFAKISTNGSPPPPCGEGLGMGVQRRPLTRRSPPSPPPRGTKRPRPPRPIPC
ncbi:hypothetical protein EOA13_23305 [Mesorhizobium sp. M7A.F.Ca.US.011.01.1.1]|nr:hypothetical protein EOA13_23305 [Mesorhizobium sp. M7A.F.Ca.US.011.01.1.1]